MTKIRTSRGELSRWLLPAQLLDIVQMQADEIGGCVFLRTNAAKFLREAWVIGKAGVLLGATRARLSRDDPPDGYLEIDGVGTLPIEVTELLQKGRCRGDENHSLEIIHQEHEELTAAIEHNAEWLQELICKKLARDRNYPPKTVLLVYHNTSLYNFCPNRTRSEFEDASRRRGENIVGSLIMYGEQIYGRALLQGSALGGY